MSIAVALPDRSPLFPTTKGTPYTSGAFSALVGSTLERITGQRASVNILRHSVITHFLSQQRTVKAKEEFAREMAHSTGMQALYDRVDAGPDSGDDDDNDPEPAPAPAPRPATAPASSKKMPKAAKLKAAKQGTPVKPPPVLKETTRGRAIQQPARYL